MIRAHQCHLSKDRIQEAILTQLAPVQHTNGGFTYTVFCLCFLHQEAKVHIQSILLYPDKVPKPCRPLGLQNPPNREGLVFSDLILFTWQASLPVVIQRRSEVSKSAAGQMKQPVRGHTPGCLTLSFQHEPQLRDRLASGAGCSQPH